MQWYWCYLVNNTPLFLRVFVISSFGQGTYYVYPNQGQWVQWYPGQMVMTLFDANTNQFVLSHTFFVTGPGQYSVLGGNAGPGQIPYQIQYGAAPANAPAAGAGPTG